MSQPTPNKISKATEGKLLDYLDKIAGYVDSGDTPNQAIVKVARSNDVELGHIRLIAQAYNNAKTNQQRKLSDDLHEKIATFKLADVREIVAELYPKEIKTAAAIDHESGVSDEYSRVPELNLNTGPRGSFIKLSSCEPTKALPREPGRRVKKAHSLLKELNRDYEEKRRLVHASRDEVSNAYDDLVYYFKQAYHDVSHYQAKVQATAMWGRPAEILMDYVVQDANIINRAGDKFASAMDRTKAPYSIIERCLNAIEKHAEYKADFRKFFVDSDIASERLVAPFLPMMPRRIYGSIVKEAGEAGPGDIISGFKEISGIPAISKSLATGTGPPDSKLKTDAFMNVTDPQHEAKIRGVRAQAMLTDMMANDPFLSGESPERVTSLYNQITKLSPRAADQPLLMRALLRRYLAQGQVDPHDIDQLAGVEVKLKQRDEPQRAYNLPELPSDFTRNRGGAPQREE